MPSSTSRDFRDTPHQPFRRIVTRATEAAADLLAVLSREGSALEERDGSGLTDTAEEKTRLVATLQELDDEQSRYLRAHRIARRRDAVAAWLRDSGDADTAGAWNRLTDLLDTCHRRNRTNGAAIELQRRHTSRVLAILHGVEHGQPLYGSLGEEKPLESSRYSASA